MCSSDLYTVNIINYTGICGSAKDTLSVLEPSVLNISSTENEVSCYGLEDGLIDVTTSGGTAPYTFLWSNNETSEDLMNIGAGSYNITITDANGCNLTENYSVSEPADIHASFEVSRDTVYLSLGEVLFLANTSSGGNSYYWDFGDGIFSTLQNPTHTYYSVGNYTITLQVFNGDCEGVVSYKVDVLAAPDDAFEPKNDYYVELIRINNQYYLDIRLEERSDVQVVVYNSLGQEVYYSATNMKEGKTLLDIQGHSSGIYMLKATVADEIFNRKFIVE